MRWIRWGLGVAVGSTLLSSPIWGPHLLQQATWFEVRHVEVTGSQFLPAHDVLFASGIHRGQNVWGEAEIWETALLAHPGIRDARVTRRLPNTLRVRIAENRPIAYVIDGTLVPVTAAGDPFPLDPSRSPLDLPIVRGPWPDTVEAGPMRSLLQEVGRLAELDPGLLAETSEIRRDDRSGVIVLTHRLGEIVLPAEASPARLAELHAVLLALDREVVEAATPQATAQVDARYAAQIVVRFQSSV